MDNFLDIIIVRKKKGLFSLLYFFASVFMIIFALVGVIGLYNILPQSQEGSGFSINWGSAIIFLVCGGIAFLLYWQRGSLKIDYDISFTNGLVELARVANNIKRKELGRFYMKEVEIAELTTSSNYNRYTSMKNIKKIDVTLNKDVKKFFLVVRIKEAAHLVIMEYNKELVALMKQYNHRNVKVD